MYIYIYTYTSSYVYFIMYILLYFFKARRRKSRHYAVCQAASGLSAARCCGLDHTPLRQPGSPRAAFFSSTSVWWTYEHFFSYIYIHIYIIIIHTLPHTYNRICIRTRHTPPSPCKWAKIGMILKKKFVLL